MVLHIQQELMQDFNKNVQDVCLSLPDDKRVNLNELTLRLTTIQESFYNPNTDRFFKAIQQLPDLDSVFRIDQPAVDISVNFPDSDELRGVLKQLILSEKGRSN